MTSMLVYQRSGEAELRTTSITGITVQQAGELLARLGAEIPDSAIVTHLEICQPNEGDFIEVHWRCR